ncbi:MAG: CBM9 family sugar-binding protein, partial [Armatimonadota bacterium]|nr:CBM9 family sugar-binding protein [Armatimonadota bacterium]
GERVEIPLSLVPEGTFVGTGRIFLDATLGPERILRTATFAVGEGGAKLPLARTALAVDGKLDDWQPLGDTAVMGAIADAAQITSGDKNSWHGPDDLSAKIYAAWAKDAIYAAVAVTDDQVVGTPAGAAPYDHDGIEFFLDGRASDMQWQKQPTEGVYQIVIGPGEKGNEPVVQVLAKSPLQGLTTALSRTTNGYIVEIKIPLTLQNFPAGDWNEGRAVRLSVLVDDKDDPKATARENVLGWSFSPEGKNFSDTSGWKTLVLSQ